MGIMEKKMETAIWGLGFWGSPNSGYLIEDPHNKEYSMLLSTLESTYFGKLENSCERANFGPLVSETRLRKTNAN